MAAMRTDLPTGTVTMLFTDVEGSTKLLREMGEGYAEALHLHRRLLRDAFTAHGGVEVDTQGDAFFIVFARASEAIAAAEDSQRALESGPIKVRMGLHTGEPKLTDEGYVGLDVHKAARIGAAGHGGQVLLSTGTQVLVDAKVKDLGPHRLKDLSAPERIYQLEILDLPGVFPPLKTLEAGMRNLPSSRTSFVGRAGELTEIERMLNEQDCRLLTLLGPGGVGKTRLALEIAAHRSDRYAHGVHFVPLASVGSADLLAPAIAESLQFAVDGAHSGFSAQDQLLDFLSERSALLVLDNFEHLVQGSGLLTRVIERAPDIEVLATSRARLEIESEWVLPIEGLRTNGNGDGSADGHAAIQLFAERARQVDPSFVLSEENQGDVSRICRLVEGLPLAIELAAAWVPSLPCAEIADEIERNIGFLETSSHDVSDRHRSLRATFDHSWRLLTEKQRQVLQWLSVFRGSFTREAAAEVAEADLGLLRELVGKSLVRRLELGRYELHELLRQYAADALAGSPDDLDETRGRHARFYLAMLAARRDGLLGERMIDARDELRLEVDNLRVAAGWATQHPDVADAREAFAGLYDFYWMHSWYEGARVFEHLVDLAGGSGEPDPAKVDPVVLSALTYRTSLDAALGYDERSAQVARECLPGLRELGLTWELGKCLVTLGTFATYLDVYGEAAGYLEEAVQVTRANQDVIELGAALSWLGFARLLLDDLDAARSAFETGYEEVTHAGNPLLRAYLLSKLGLLADAEQEFASAMRSHMQARELFDGAGDRAGAGYTLSRASGSAYGLGDHEEAMRLAQAGYEAFGEVNHRWGMITALCRLGFATMALGEEAQARVHLREALERARDSEARSQEMLALSGVGMLLHRQGQDRRAAAILTFALDPTVLPPAYSLPARPVLEALERSLPPEELAAARETAAGADLGELVAEALRDHLG